MANDMSERYILNFNQDYTAISVLSKTGFGLFTINAIDKVDEIFAMENTEPIRILERLFSSSLVVLVTEEKPNCMKMLHFKKNQDICNCVYPSDILCVRMNRHRLIVCLAESIYIHDIRDMKILHSIENIAPNESGLCSISLDSYLAFPICSTSGELRIFNADNLKTGIAIKAHATALTALDFSPCSKMLATASERGTVIRLFCVQNGQKLQEFRRGVKRCVRIASLVFSATGNFLCASSNTETVHIFKIDAKTVKATEQKPITASNQPKKHNSSQLKSASKKKTANNAAAKSGSPKSATVAKTPPSVNPSNNQHPASTVSKNTWSMSEYITKAVSSYFIPSQIGDVWAQDRAFATAVLSQPGLKHVCGLVLVQNELRLFMACEDGFLYIYDFNNEKGGLCKLLQVHDLRFTLEGVIELNFTDSMEDLSICDLLPSTPTTNPSGGFSANTPITITAVSSHSKSSSYLSTSPRNKSNSSSSVSVIIENPNPSTDNSYAGILKTGTEQTANGTLTDSAKYRKLCDAIDTPAKLYDEKQFPPVDFAAKE